MILQAYMFRNLRAMRRSEERGVSLLIVVLIGSILVLTAVSLAGVAKRVTQSSQSYLESIQSAYTTEDVFLCVRQWVVSGPNTYDSFELGNTIWCGDKAKNEVTFGGSNYSSAGGFSTSKFVIEHETGAVDVEVIRDQSRPNRFVGRVLLRGYNVGDVSPRKSERFREYELAFGSDFQGADIMFAIDRSGSIEGNRDPANPTGEWKSLLDAVSGVVQSIEGEIPAPHVGFVSFGTDRNDVGLSVTHAECNAVYSANPYICTEQDWRKPEVSMVDVTTDDIDFLLDTATKIPKIDTTPSETNLSLGLAVAGAELMGKYYPGGDYTLLPGAPLASGGFERIVAVWNNGASSPNFNDLPDQLSGGMNRPDADFPNYIILITDGIPNGIIRHTDDLVSCQYADGGASATTIRGDAVFFQPTSGNPGKGCLASDITYYYCNDEGLDGLGIQPKPTDFPEFTSNGDLNQSRCNSFLIAEALKKQGIIISVIGVGSDVDDAFLTMVASTDRYFKVDEYSDIVQLFAEFGEKIIPLELR
jgi:hypothetical protein